MLTCLYHSSIGHTRSTISDSFQFLFFVAATWERNSVHSVPELLLKYLNRWKLLSSNLNLNNWSLRNVDSKLDSRTMRHVSIHAQIITRGRQLLSQWQQTAVKSWKSKVIKSNHPSTLFIRCHGPARLGMDKHDKIGRVTAKHNLCSPKILQMWTVNPFELLLRDWVTKFALCEPLRSFTRYR